jgi:hypothetical protein
MDDEALRQPEDLACQRKVLRPRLPERRDAVVEHAVCEEPARKAVLRLHRGEVAGRVATGEGDTRHEVVEDELVEHDDARAAAHGLDDPPVRLRVVADVVEGDICLRRTTEAAGARDLDVDPLLKRRKKQRAVVGDPRT